MCVCECVLCLHLAQRPEEETETGVRDGCELPSGCWESNQVLCKSIILTSAASLHVVVPEVFVNANRPLRGHL